MKSLANNTFCHFSKTESITTKMIKNLLIILTVFFAVYSCPVKANAGLKTNNVVQVTAHSMTIHVKAPSASAAPGVSQLMMVLRKDDNPQWFPKDGTDYSQEEAENAAGEGYVIVMEDSSNGQEHDIVIDNLEMGTRYLFKPWFKYNDGGGVKYISSGTQYASDEFYRHQEVLNTLAAELAKLTYELEKLQELPESSFTKTLLNNTINDAKEKFKEGVTEGIKNYVMDRVLKKAGVGALEKLSDVNREKITKFYNDAKAVYDQGKEYAEVLQTVNDGLQADNPALELSRAAVTILAPWSEPLFYTTEVLVDTYADTAGIKAEIEVLTESTDRMRKHLEEEAQTLVDLVDSETYYGFCVTDLGGVLDHDFTLKMRDMPYVVSSDLIISQTPAADDQDQKVTLSIPLIENFIVVWLKDSVNIIVEKGAEFNVEGGIFDKAEGENWGGIIYKEGSLGKFVMTDVYNGGKGQDAQLIIRSSGSNDNGFELYTDLYASESAGVLIENAKVNADVYVGAKHNKGPGIWLKSPVKGTFLKRVISKYNYQGILFEGADSLANAEVKTGVGSKIEENHHPGTPVGSEDIVFKNMDYTNTIGKFITNMDMLKPVKGILFIGKQIEFNGKTIRQFTIPPGTQFAISDDKLKTIRYSDSIKIEGKVDIDGEITVLADSENIQGFIEVKNGGELNAAKATFTCLDSNRNWDGVRYLESAAAGKLDNVTFSEGGAGSIGAQLTVESHVEVTDSLFTHSRGIGVKVDQPVGVPPLFNKNKIEFTKKHGLYAYNVSSNFKPRENIFDASNGDRDHYFAVYAFSLDGSKLDAINNYWDDEFGPSAVDNPGGMGATAGALVDFDPWIGKKATDAVPDSGSGSPLFTSQWSTDLQNGGYNIRYTRHSANVLVMYPSLTLSDVPLEDEKNDGKTSISAEQIFICYADGYKPGVKISENSLGQQYMDCDNGTSQLNYRKADKVGHKIGFIRVAYKTIKDLQNYPYKTKIQYRIIDRGYFIPFYIGGSFDDITTLTAAGSPYLMKGEYTGTIKIEPQSVILIPQGGITLRENASLIANGATFISVNIPDKNGDGIISDEEAEAYMSTIRSLRHIKPEGNNAKFYTYKGCRISMNNCLVINSQMGSSTYKSSTSQRGCNESGLTIKNSKLYNFSPANAGGLVEISDNIISNYSTEPPDISYDTEYRIKASSANEQCPVTFKNNIVNTPAIKVGSRWARYLVYVKGGVNDVDISGNVITGGNGLDISITSSSPPSAKKVMIADNKLYDSQHGIEISSYSSTPSEFFNINRLSITDNYVRIDPDSKTPCGADCKIPIPGLTIKNFTAIDTGTGMAMTASGNDVELAGLSGTMHSGDFTVTSGLAEGLAGSGRTIALTLRDVIHPSLTIKENAKLTITGEENRPITVLSLFNPNIYIYVYGTLNAEHTIFRDYYSAHVQTESPHTNGIRYYENSTGILDHIRMEWMKNGITVESGDVIIRNSIFSDNSTAVWLLNAAATIENNRFIRNNVGLSLDVKDPSTDTFSAIPIIKSNIFEANPYGIKINRLAAKLSLNTGNTFIGDNKLTGIKVENNVGGAVDGTYIYWGDNSGPTLPEDQKNGTGGAKLEDTEHVVTYEPWATLADSFTVTPSVGSGQGSISPSAEQTADYGEQIQFSLAPANGYHLKSVVGTCGGTLDAGNNTFTTDGVTSDCTVVANFGKDTYILEVSYLGRGRITGDGIDCPGDCTEEYKYGTAVALLARGNRGYGFNNWINCDNPSGNNCAITIDKDKTCTAVFTKGDASGDGKVDLADAIIILKLLAGMPVTAQEINYLDINNDKKAGLLEALIILEKISGR